MRADFLCLHVQKNSKCTKREPTGSSEDFHMASQSSFFFIKQLCQKVLFFFRFDRVFSMVESHGRRASCVVCAMPEAPLWPYPCEWLQPCVPWHWWDRGDPILPLGVGHLEGRYT